MYVISKVLETLVYQNIIKFLSLVYYQTSLASWVTGLASIHVSCSHVAQVINCRSQLDVIFVDLHKALDTIGHNELLMKLSKLGISSSLWQWFGRLQYLNNRAHRGTLNSYSSTALVVMPGSPQKALRAFYIILGLRKWYFLCNQSILSPSICWWLSLSLISWLFLRLPLFAESALGKLIGDLPPVHYYR